VAEKLKSNSSDEEDLILVNDKDEVLGFRPQAEVHDGNGLLHRAFSIFLFNSAGQVLIQQRSQNKRLWPGFWSNSCCSHPRRGETTERAGARRLQQELGLSAPLMYLYKFIYRARFGDNIGSEYEFCSVLLAKSDSIVRADPREIAGWRFVDAATLDVELVAHPERYTPWFRMEWRCMRHDHAADISNFLNWHS